MQPRGVDGRGAELQQRLPDCGPHPPTRPDAAAGSVAALPGPYDPAAHGAQQRPEDPAPDKTRAQSAHESTAISPSASTDKSPPLSSANPDPAHTPLSPPVEHSLNQVGFFGDDNVHASAATVDMDRVTYGLLVEILGIAPDAPSRLDMGDHHELGLLGETANGIKYSIRGAPMAVNSNPRTPQKGSSSAKRPASPLQSGRSPKTPHQV
ncbi:hypothetical protein PENPOL_c022G03451 [Penicillium polonicum]|uniref:Uncharacterized protein n=1 Tax=Penicillium polonicum TaxID=60169 RepID=A0A1V6N764_PENPO|nr:hypothetical protein PENPOL_c022G03451 [Penicillium polonicum]